MTREEKYKELEALGSPPTPPLDPVLLVEEPTYEGLVKLLQLGQPSLGLFSDEGGRLLGGHGMSQENQLKTGVGLCELWDGKRISRVRSGDGAHLIYGKRVSMHIMIQPVLTARLFSTISSQVRVSCLDASPSGQPRQSAAANTGRSTCSRTR